MWRQRKRLVQGASAAGIGWDIVGTPLGTFRKVFKVKVKIYVPGVYDPVAKMQRTGNS